MKKLKPIIKKQYSRYREFILYGIIGGISAGVDFCVFTLLCKIDIPYLIANVASVHCGIICSFTLNRHFNFKVKDKIKRRFTYFYLTAIAGLAISSSILYILITLNGFKDIYAKLIALVVVGIFQFCMNKFITFKKH